MNLFILAEGPLAEALPACFCVGPVVTPEFVLLLGFALVGLLVHVGLEAELGPPLVFLAADFAAVFAADFAEDFLLPLGFEMLDPFSLREYRRDIAFS